MKVVVAEEQTLEGPRTLHMGRWLKSACIHVEVWTAEPLVTDRPPELLTPSRVGVLTFGMSVGAPEETR
jgi:hypothetical protein